MARVFAVIAMCVALWLMPTQSARAQSADEAYAKVANWLFDLYLGQSIQLTVFNATKVRPGADTIVAPQLPAMLRFMERHREIFVSAIKPPLQTHVPAQDITALLQKTAVKPPALDEQARARLIEVDQEFRRDAQAVIRAMTIDIGLIINDTLSQVPR